VIVPNKESPNEGLYLSTIPEGSYSHPDKLLNIIGKKVKVVQIVLSLPSGLTGGDREGVVVALFSPNHGEMITCSLSQSQQEWSHPQKTR
jgi:hypothetical protein